MAEPRIAVVGATGAVGEVALGLLAERGFRNVRAFASERSAGNRVAFGDRELLVEAATPEALGRDIDICFFSVGTDASRELVVVKVALEQFGRGQPVSWIQVDTDKALGKVTERPTRDAIPIAAQEQLIVELYSK